MLVLIGAFCLGAVFVILIELYALYRWFQVQPISEPTHIPTYIPVSNPEDIAKYCGLDGATDKETCMFLNLIFQFLWKEWRDSPKTRNFFIRKMNMEFQEMLLNKAAGKVMEQITVRDYNLGDSLPVFKNVTVMKIDCKPPSMMHREVDLAVDIDYTGGFIISLDVDLIFGKKASMTVRLKSLSGRIRLQFTRNPCTHWSFSFYEDPKMDLFVDSNFEGRKLPKLTTLISNQIRKAIKKKHTLPRYKVRYKPFFVQEKPQDGKNEVYLHNSLVTVGKLDLEIIECTRIPQLPKGSHVYCSLMLDPLPWKEDMPMRRSLWPVHEVLMCRAPSGSIGVSFSRYFENDHEIIMIKTITPNSPASHVDIQRGDLLISVNNVDITTMKQAVRLIKNAGDKFTFKLQRPPPVELQQSPFLDTNNESPPPTTTTTTTTETDFMDLKDKKQQNNNTATNNKQYSSGSSSTNSAMENRMRNTDTTKDDDFDYNSVLVREDEDSDSEEFVNIVVNEISEELSNDEAKRSEFLNTVHLLTPSLSPRSSSSNSQRTDTPDGDNNDYAQARLNLSIDTLPVPVETLSNISPPVRRRSVPFLRKVKSTSSLLKIPTKADTEASDKNSISSKKTSSRSSKLKNWLESSFSALNGDLPDRGGGTPEKPNKQAQQQQEKQKQEKQKHIRIAEPETTSTRSYTAVNGDVNSPLLPLLKRQERFSTSHDLNSPIHHRDSIDSDGGGNVADTESEHHEWDNISHKNVCIEVQPHVEEDKEPTGQTSSLLNANKELVWNETFAFDVEKEHRFLNVCVWCKHEDSFEKDVLLGYVSVPLMELAVECLSTSSRKNLRIFNLAATSSRSAISRAYLRTVMPGMNVSMCNGDITLAYQYNIAVPEGRLEEEQLKVVMERLKKCEESQPEESLTDQEGVKEHNFIGQEFYFPTRCDYCQNKVWRKVAFQCRVCAMVSHKRCIQKSQANTYCTTKGVRARPPKWEVKEEPATESTNNASDHLHKELQQITNSGGQSNITIQIPLITVEENYTTTILSSSIKDHEDDLRPGIKNGNSSPNNVLRRRHKLPHQSHSRRLSWQDFVSEEQSIESIPEDVEEGDLNDSIATAAVTAKEAGRELYASLDKDGRHEGIQEKVRQIQSEIASENEQQIAIRTTLENTGDDETKQSIEASLRKSEERSQALALLMIQYCAALNECISASEPQHV